ncbi:MAG: DNA alkylation repair protein [Prolixibacteraceae bacterium]|nr:DNA alkylation repair protein [Prolixibacteraceae bacterium]
MTTSELIQDIKTYCLANADAERLQKSQRFFKKEFVGHGLTAPQVYAKVKELQKGGGINLPMITEAAPTLMKGGMYEEISMALLLLDGQWKEFTPETFQTIAGWFSISITNWAHADTLAMFTLPKFLDKKIVEMKDFGPWLGSPFKFQRRCVPVTLIKHVKKTREVMPSINFVERLMADPEREVHQGMGWFLREAWKINPEEVEPFLLKYKDSAPRLIFQYACEKMDSNAKLKFKRTMSGEK